MATDELLVIGAGPVGLAAAKALRDAGVAHAHVEATDHVGGNWAHGVYETAHIISSRRTTEYSDWPMPADYPDFPSAEQMRAYYQAYADAHGLTDALRFEARVVAVRPQPDQRWRVDFEDGPSELFKGVVVANGHHWARRLPGWAADFDGELLHSKDYKRPEQLRGKRVLVVGGGNSGCDIVSEAARVGASADWSLRRGYHFLPKTVLGRPTVELMTPWMPVAVQRLLLRGLVRVTLGRYTRYGLPRPDHRLFETHPTVNTEVFHYLAHGRARAVPDVASVVGHTVRFADGTEREYDLVVCATGYDVAFPFFEPGLVPVHGKVAQVIGGMLVPGRRHLYIFGAFQPRYGLGPLATPGAELLARWAQLQDELDVPLADVLVAMGQKPPTTHLLDPHATIRRLRRARRLDGLIRWRARGLARGATAVPVGEITHQRGG